MIINPLNNKSYSLFNSIGRDLLKLYIENYNNGGSLEEFEEKRGLETDPYKWTAIIPTREKLRPSIRDRNPYLGFNNTYYNPRPPLAPEIEKRLFSLGCFRQ